MALRAGHRSFLKHLKEFETAIQDAGGLATDLYSHGLIDKMSWERAGLLSVAPLERSRELLQKLESKIKSDESAFDTLLSILDKDPTMNDVHKKMSRMYRLQLRGAENNGSASSASSLPFLVALLVAIFLVLVVWYFQYDCYQVGLCQSKSLPSVDNFVGREEDIHNITGYLDFTTSDVQVVHIVGPPGFGKSTLAMKIGHILVRKWVTVHYVDLQKAKDIDTMAERVMSSIVESIKNKPTTFDHLLKWVRNQHSNTVIILDNCDEIIDNATDEFFDSLANLLHVSPKMNVKYITTSQKWVADIGNFRLHPIYNLSSEAAIELLSRVAPSLTDDQKIEIADLTGNVPLALRIVGAIFRFPDAPSVDEVIGRLRENLIDTLSPDVLRSKVNTSIFLAFSYLSPELQQLCVNLSHFPGSFNTESVSFVYYTPKLEMLNTLVHRSLLQYIPTLKRYFFHQLLQEYFLQVTVNEDADSQLKRYFNNRFLLYFTQLLRETIPEACEHEHEIDIVKLQTEEVNFRHILFLLIDNHTDLNTTFHVIKTLGNNKRMAVFTKIISPQIPLIIYKFLESFEPEERAMFDSFFEVYVEVILLAVKARDKPDIAIEFLSPKQHMIEKAYKQHNLSAKTYTKYFHILADYYEKNGDVKRSKWYHIRVLKHTTSELEHCDHDCDYYSVSVAYHKTGDKEMAFYYRKLAYSEQDNMEPMSTAYLWLELYKDYLSHDNDNDVEELRVKIQDKIFPFLINADWNAYSEDAYVAAIKHFKNLNMKEHAIRLQEKVFEIINEKDRNEERIMQCAQDCTAHRMYYAISLDCIHLAVLLGKQTLPSESKSMQYSFTVGYQLYYIGNYSESRVWLQRSLELVREAIVKEYSVELRNSRRTVCFYLILSGDTTEPLCYAYYVKDTASWLGRTIVDEIQQKYIIGSATVKQPQSQKSSMTALTTEKQTYIWQYYDAERLKNAFQQKIEIIGKKVFQTPLRHPLIVWGILISVYIPLIYILSISIIIKVASFMHTCCSERQKACCMSCFSFCIIFSCFLTVLVYLFLLFLDELY